jgi:hypothetical protein
MGAIRSRDFHKLVVQPKDQKRRRPLTDEETGFSTLHELERQRRCDAGAGRPQERIRWQPRRLVLECTRQPAFAVPDRLYFRRPYSVHILDLPMSESAGESRVQYLCTPRASPMARQDFGKR